MQRLMIEFSDAITHRSVVGVREKLWLEHAIASSSNFVMDNLKLFSELDRAKNGEI